PYGLAGIEVPDSHGPSFRNRIQEGRGEATAVTVQSDGADHGAAFEGGFEQIARRRVPELEPVSDPRHACPRNEPLAVRGEFQSRAGAVVPRECDGSSPGGGQGLDRLVLPAGGDEPTVGAEHDAAREALVSVEVGERAARGDLPQLEAIVLARRNEPLAVRA